MDPCPNQHGSIQTRTKLSYLYWFTSGGGIQDRVLRACLDRPLFWRHIQHNTLAPWYQGCESSQPPFELYVAESVLIKQAR